MNGVTGFIVVAILMVLFAIEGARRLRGKYRQEQIYIWVSIAITAICAFLWKQDSVKENEVAKNILAPIGSLSFVVMVASTVRLIYRSSKDKSC